MATKKKIGRPLKSSRNSEVDSKNSGVGKCDPDEFLKKELLEKASTTLKVSPKSLLPLTKSQLCEIVDGKSPSKVSTKAVAAVQRKTVPTKKGRPAGATTKKVTTVGSSAKKVGKSVPATRTTEKCPGGKKKAEVAELVSKKFKVSQEEALRLKVAEMCDALATSTPPTIPPPKKVRPKYSPEFISVGSPTRKRKTSKKSLPPLAATPSPLRFVKIGVEVPRSPKAKVPLPRNVKDLECVRKSKLALKDYQLRVVNHFQTNRGLIVAHPVGSGKTLEGVTVVACFLNKHPKGIAKIVTPVSLQYNFQKELKAAGVSSDRIEFYTLAAFAKQHAAGGDKYGTCTGASSSRGGGRPVILVVDEAHELRTNISKARASGKITRAEVAVKCAMEADEVLLLTATAVYNEPYDVASLVAMAKGTVPLSIKSFEALVDSPDPARFRDYFGCMFSFHDMPRDENYPSVTKRYIEIEMSAKYFKEYKEVERRNSSLFSGKNPFLFLSGVRRASNALSSCPKCDVVMNFVNFGLPVKVDSRGTPTFSTTRPKKPVKIVVFSAFREYGIDKLAERLKTAKVPFGEVQGSMSKESRQRSVDRYNSDQDQVLLITAAGGQGLDLKGTRVMIIFEEQWNKSIEEQVEGRAVRYRSHAHLPESERNVQIYHLIMVKPRSSTDKRPSADVILRNLVEEKGVNNMKFLKRLQAVSIEQMTCGAHPISSSPPKFSPVAIPKEKKSKSEKERTWDKLISLSKKVFKLPSTSYEKFKPEAENFTLRISNDLVDFYHERPPGTHVSKIQINKKGEVTAHISTKKSAKKGSDVGSVKYKKGQPIPSDLEKSATLLETLLEEVLLADSKKSPLKPVLSPVKKGAAEAYTELFRGAYENIKDRSGDWKNFGSLDRFTEGSFARKFPDLGLDKGRGNFGQWMTMLLPDVWSTSILMRPTGSVDVDFNNKSGKNIPYDQAPPATRKRATEALEFLANLDTNTNTNTNTWSLVLDYASKLLPNEEYSETFDFNETTFTLSGKGPEFTFEYRGSKKFELEIHGTGDEVVTFKFWKGVRKNDRYFANDQIPAEFRGEVSTLETMLHDLLLKQQDEVDLEEFVELYEKAYVNVMERDAKTGAYRWRGLSKDILANDSVPYRDYLVKYGKSFSAEQGPMKEHPAHLKVKDSRGRKFKANLGHFSDGARLSSKVFFLKDGDFVKFSKLPEDVVGMFRERLEFLSNMKFASGSPLKPPTVMGAPLIKSPVQKTLGERMSKLDYTRLFMEAYENIKDPKYWSSGYFDFDFSASKFGGSTYVRDESKSGEKKIDLFYDVRKDIYLTTLRIASTGNTTVDFLTVYGSSIAYEKVPDSVLNAAIERLEFLRDLELEYFMDKFYNRLVRNFDRAREIYGKKEVNWAKIPGTSYEFSLVGKTLGIQLKKVGMVTYSEGNQKLIFYDEKGQMQNPYKLGDSQFGKWLPLKEHPAKIQNFFSTMTVGMGELEKYFAKKL